MFHNIGFNRGICIGRKRMYLKPKDTMTIGISFCVIFCLHIVGWLLWGDIVLVIFLPLMLGVIVFIQTEHYRSIRNQFQQQDGHFRQIEALFSLFRMIKPRYPLPPLGGWAIAPDFANLLISHIHEHAPKVILELGSGTSTLIAAYGVKEHGEGKIYSLEHSKECATNTTNMLKKHGLQDMAEVIHAPLKTIVLGEEKWLWYDTQQISSIPAIDLLIVDGPPKKIQKMGRYPALPLLFEKLSENATVLLDDSKRKDETKIVERWLSNFHELQCEWVETERGTAILRKTPMQNLST